MTWTDFAPLELRDEAIRELRMTHESIRALNLRLDRLDDGRAAATPPSRHSTRPRSNPPCANGWHGERRMVMHRGFCWVFRHEPWWVELWSGSAAVLWGLFVFCMPVHLGQMPAFTLLHYTTRDPSAVWGPLLFSAGAAQVAVVLLNRRALRWMAALVLGILWAIVGGVVHTSLPLAPSVTLYACWALAMAYSVCRLPIADLEPK
ncbi:MAG: hypothetical protein JO209_07760 [Acidisphaera sp.]|nr:hypothetical protein [Acidisphaera sp.]